jgi:hypothetical protein
MNWKNLYEYGVSPLKVAEELAIGGKYATSNGDIVVYNSNGTFTRVNISPLAVTVPGKTEEEENTVENLTELQLTLYWALCKYENENENN